MKEGFSIKRTTGDNADFAWLISHLDDELWNELNEDQSTYDQYNKVPGIQTALVLYINERPVASGCFKVYSADTVEIKRMFVEKEFRGRGLSSIILKELEDWAGELGYRYAILETSIHFVAARTLYAHAGYAVIENYDQYKGLPESVCMKKELTKAPSSEFRNIPDIEYFLFEEDFVEKDIRCIPMIVRFKMDHAGIKLKLAEWSRFPVTERIGLAQRPCADPAQVAIYKQHLVALIKEYAGNEATEMNIENKPAWSDLEHVPEILNNKLEGFGWHITRDQWKGLTDLQRFALLKLCKGGHENKNFPKAMKEFKLISA